MKKYIIYTAFILLGVQAEANSNYGSIKPFLKCYLSQPGQVPTESYTFYKIDIMARMGRVKIDSPISSNRSLVLPYRFDTPSWISEKVSFVRNNVTVSIIYYGGDSVTLASMDFSGREAVPLVCQKFN